MIHQCVGIVLALVSLAPAGEPIKHRFLAADESGHQLMLVDQFDPSKDWTIPLKGNRDIQLLDEKRLLASFPGGYRARVSSSSS